MDPAASHQGRAGSLQAVLFDMDGTLIDTEPLWQAAEEHMMAGYGIEWTDEDQRHCHGGAAERVTNYMADRVAETGQPRPDPARFVAGFEDYMLAHIGDGVRVQPGASSLLREVHESQLASALVTSSQGVLMRAVLKSLGSRWFDVTVCADDVERHKPDPLPYRTAAEALGVDVHRCLVIEDSPTGVASAQSAGAYVVAVDHSAAFDPAERRTVIPGLDGVTLAMLRSWYDEG